MILDGPDTPQPHPTDRKWLLRSLFYALIVVALMMEMYRVAVGLPNITAPFREFEGCGEGYIQVGPSGCVVDHGQEDETSVWKRK